MQRHSSSLVVAAAFAALMLLPQRSGAAVLVYENFSSNSLGSLTGQAAGGQGLTGNYGANGSGTASFTVTSGGLAFGTLSSGTGNSVVASSTNAGFVSVAQLSIGPTPYTGTLYSSYLVNFSQLSTATGLGELRVTSTSTAAGASSRFRLAADSATASSATPSAAYDATFASSSFTLSSGVTYLMIGRYTNVGSSLNGTTTGVATSYALTLAQYNAFIAGGGTDSYLDTAGLGSGSSQITARVTTTPLTTGTFSFASGNFVQMAVAGSTGSTEAFRYDELRFGDSLQAVAVPEPGLFSLLICGGVLLAGLNRNRRSARSSGLKS